MYPIYIFRGWSVVLLFVLASCAPAAGSDYIALTFEESLEGVSGECPRWILENQVLLDVAHWGFDGRLHRGQIVVDERVAGDLRLVFLQMLLIGFPLESVVPISELGWDDSVSMSMNNTSGFNYRTVPGTDRLSRHAYGLAIDINPFLNPYCPGGRVSPPGAVYDPEVPGALYAGHPVVELFRLLGWRWGGDWTDRDYQHFDKPLESEALTDVDHRRSILPWRLL